MSVFSVRLVHGEWYILINCQNCNTKHVLFPDLTKGASDLKATYRWTCPTCQHHGDYDSDSLERYQHLGNEEK